MLRFILCDDDEIQLGEMVDFTRQWADANKLTAEISQFTSAAALLEQFHPQRNDILLMDILMPGIDGITVAKNLRRQRADFHIIFMSSSENFALEAYAAHPYSYIVKPVAYSAYSQLLDNLLQKVHQQILSVNCGCNIYNLPIMDISVVEAVNRKLIFSMKDGSTVVANDTLTSIQQTLLKYPAFFKPHRSYIINMQYVEHFNTKEIYIKNYQGLIPIARGLDKELKDQYFKYMFSK